MTDIGTLSCVADSSRSCPASNLPALYPFGYGAYLYVDPRFCLRLPSGAHCCNTLAFGYPSPPSGLDLDFARYACHNIGHHHLAAGPCPAHIGIGRSLTAPPSHTTQHTGPYCAIRLIRQVQLQGNESPSDSKCLSGKAILTHFTLLIRQGPLRAQPVVTA